MLFIQPGRTDEFIIKIQPGGPDFVIHPSDMLPWKNSVEKEFFVRSISFKGSLASKNLHGTHPFSDIYKFEIETDRSDNELLDNLNNSSDILWAEKNHPFRIHLIPNDSLYDQQWALSRIRMPEAWDIQQGDSAIIVGIIDTGIDYLHEDLQHQLWVNTTEDLNHNGRLDAGDLNGLDDDGNGYTDDVIGWDFTDAPSFPDEGDFLNPDNDPMDEYPGGHGTPVAGIVAALTNNRAGIAGIAPGAKVMALRAGTAGGYLEEDDVAEAVLYAVDNGCRIINMSFGDIVFSHLIKEAVDYGTNRGVIFVASAGNSGNTVLHFPAAYDNTLAVGATNINDDLASFSNYGSKIDVVAPGQGIFSCSLGNSYGEYNGTSFAAPAVCGILALLWSADPEESSAIIKSALQNGCRDLGNPGWDVYYGHGRVDAYKSLLSSQSTVARIEFPHTGSGTGDSSVAIIGTATGSDFREYSLSFGMAENPLKMELIGKNCNRIVSDTLGIWNTRNLKDSVYTLEVKIQNWDNSTTVNRVVIFLDRTPPHYEDIQFIPMVVKNYYGYLVSLTTDDQTRATLYFRNAGSSGPFRVRESGYRSNEHSFLLTQEDGRQQMELYLEVVNSSGLVTVNNNDGRWFHLDLSMPDTFDESISLIHETAGSGYLLGESVDIDGDGLRDVLGNFSIPGHPGNRLGSLNYNQNSLLVRLSQTAAFPRDIFDADGDGRPELLAGYGPASFLFPGLNLPGFTGSPVISPQEDFWATRMFDMGGGEPLEIIALHNNQWQLFQLENLQNFSVSFNQDLQNPTGGENNYGIPFAGVEDMDGNGKPEIILGDSDGDLILYQAASGNNFQVLTTMRMRGEDATYSFGTGDFDGDGLPEIAIATRKLAEYVGESSVQNQYWILQVLKLSGTGQLETVWEQNFYEVNTGRNRYSGVTVDDYDSDGMDEIFFTPYPRAYYIQFRNDAYQVNWYTSGVNANACPRLSDNQVLMSGDSSLMVWQLDHPALRPSPPTRLIATGADTLHIGLQWSSVTGANEYIITRKNKTAFSTFQFVTGDTFFIDSTVVKDGLYEYSVQSVDSLFPQPLSLPARSVYARAENPPFYLNLRVEADHQVMVEFNKPLGENSFTVEHYLLLPDSARPVSTIRARGGRGILLGFDQQFSGRLYKLLLNNLCNIYNIPFYTDSLIVPFEVYSSPQNPYLERIEAASRYELLLFFNHPMEQSSTEDTSNYMIEPEDDVIKAVRDQQDNRIIHVFLTGRNRLGSLGTDYYLRMKGLKDIWGKTIMADTGERFLVRESVENLDNFIVFPNPLRPGTEEDKITFGNVPKGCEIFIFTANGEAVIKLKSDNYTGGVKWNLQNSGGTPVNSGVYIYVAVLKDRKKNGKFIIMK